MLKHVFPVLAFGLAIASAHCGVSCKPADGPTTGDIYTAEQVACAVNGATLEDIHKCRGAVDRKYGLCESEQFPQPCGDK